MSLSENDVEAITRFIDARLDAQTRQIVDAVALASVETLRKANQANMRIEFGEIATVTAGFVDVILDIDGNSIPALTISTVAVADRVAVLLWPPSGALVLGKFL